MSDLIKSISSPSWWLGVVLVSFLINLASAYAKSPLDALLSRTSRRWAERSARARKARDALVSALAKDQHLQLLYLAKEARCRFRELLWVMMAVLVLVSFVAESILQSDLTQSSAAHFWFNSWEHLSIKIALVLILIVAMVSSLSQRLEAIKLASLVRDANRSEL